MRPEICGRKIVSSERMCNVPSERCSRVWDGLFHIANAKRDGTTERLDETGSASAKAKECKTVIETNMQ